MGLTLALAACGREELPASAKVEIRDQLLAARSRPYHERDGTGRAWIEAGPRSVRAGSFASWTFLYECGAPGIRKGGALYFQAPPFWEWSTPQTYNENAPGFCQVSSLPSPVPFQTRTVDRQLLCITFVERDLEPGERVRIDYGTSAVGTHVDPYAESAERFVFAVDGDGDGLRKACQIETTIRIEPNVPAALSAVWPSVARPKSQVELIVAALDQRGNAFLAAEGKLEWDLPFGCQGPREHAWNASDRGVARIAIQVGEASVLTMPVRLKLSETTLQTSTNPLQVSANAPPVYWADLHGHTGLTDGTGTTEDYFSYARDVAGLDIAAVTDHDHWGLDFLDENPGLWSASVAAARAATEPGKFLALPGYEWTSWIWGHRHVVFFGTSTPLLSSLDPAFDTPLELWTGLQGQSALSIPHHPAGGPIALDWRHVGHAQVEPVVEIVSAHGASDAASTQAPIYSAVPSAYVQDHVRGDRLLGFIGGGDSHDGHPGMAHRMPHYPCGGLAAVLAEELSAPSVLAALRERRVYATNGPRILLRVALGSSRMGQVARLAECSGPDNLFIQVFGTAPIRSIEVMRGNKRSEVEHSGAGSLTVQATLEGLAVGECVWVRVLQEDGGAAWSSPIVVGP